jgi:hypothetical protein
VQWDCTGRTNGSSLCSTEELQAQIMYTTQKQHEQQQSCMIIKTALQEFLMTYEKELPADC